MAYSAPLTGFHIAIGFMQAPLDIKTKEVELVQHTIYMGHDSQNACVSRSTPSLTTRKVSLDYSEATHFEIRNDLCKPLSSLTVIPRPFLLV